jgi:hypothetical protein
MGTSYPINVILRSEIVPTDLPPEIKDASIKYRQAKTDRPLSKISTEPKKPKENIRTTPCQNTNAQRRYGKCMNNQER